MQNLRVWFVAFNTFVQKTIANIIFVTNQTINLNIRSFSDCFLIPGMFFET